MSLSIAATGCQRLIACILAGNWGQCLQDGLAAIQTDHTYVKGASIPHCLSKASSS